MPVALAVLSVGPAAAVAGSAQYQSLDAMGLASGKGMRTPCTVSGEYEGKTYCFRNEDAKAEFMKDADGNRAKADSYYGSMRYSESSPNIPDSCD
jgi:YHS domain-containing protein